MTRHLALLILSATLVSCMEMKETVQRMVMVRTTGSDTEPETNGFIYKRESDGPPKVIKMGQEEVMEELTKIYKFPQAFYAPVPFAAGPFYNKEEDSHTTGSIPKIIPVFENIVESSEIKSDSVPAAAEHSVDHSKYDAPNLFDDYTSDFNDYLASLGYHDDFYRGGSWSDYGNANHHDVSAAKSSPNQYRYNIDKDTPGSYSTEKYAIYTLSTTGSSETNDKYNDPQATSSAKENKRTENLDKDNSKASKNHDNFHKEEYASEFDGYYKTNDNDYEKPSHDKKVDKYHGDFDVYEYQKNNDDSHVKASRELKRFPNPYDYVEAGDKADEEERADNLDLNGRVAQELRDCCYEEKPNKDEASNEGDIKVQHKSYIYKDKGRQ